MNNNISNQQQNVNPLGGDNLGIPNDQNTAQPQDNSDNDPIVFLAHQILEIKNQLKTEIENMRTEMKDTIKQDMAMLRDDIKSALSE